MLPPEIPLVLEISQISQVTRAGLEPMNVAKLPVNVVGVTFIF